MSHYVNVQVPDILTVTSDQNVIKHASNFFEVYPRSTPLPNIFKSQWEKSATQYLFLSRGSNNRLHFTSCILCLCASARTRDSVSYWPYLQQTLHSDVSDHVSNALWKSSIKLRGYTFCTFQIYHFYQYVSQIELNVKIILFVPLLFFKKIHSP